VLNPVLFHPFVYMGSGVVYYKPKAHKDYDDIDIEATTELGTIKTIEGFQPMDASAELDFLRFLMNGTRPVYSSSGSCPMVDS
ncbi:hypothetical protein PIB30_100148, partial [Stylosanthes scabra]|nr:hypothetical protein [Stylosanthes scabra]